MKRKLTREPKSTLYHLLNGERVDGAPQWLRGDCSGLYGDCTGLRGNCTGLRGNCTGLRGDLDGCELTASERTAGMRLFDLVAAATE